MGCTLGDACFCGDVLVAGAWYSTPTFTRPGIGGNGGLGWFICPSTCDMSFKSCLFLLYISPSSVYTLYERGIVSSSTTAFLFHFSHLLSWIGTLSPGCSSGNGTAVLL